MLAIPMAARPSFTVDAALDGKSWILRFDWNAAARIWTMAIADATKTWQIQGVVLVPNYPVLMGFHHLPIPPGQFVADMRDGSCPLAYDSFTTEAAVLYYVTEAESAALWTHI